MVFILNPLKPHIGGRRNWPRKTPAFFLNEECEFKLALWEIILNFVYRSSNVVDNCTELVNWKGINSELKYSTENWFCKFHPRIYSPTDLLG